MCLRGKHILQLVHLYGFAGGYWGILGEGGFCTASKGRYAENIKFASIDPKIRISCQIYRYIPIFMKKKRENIPTKI